jgi:3-methyladenine DNA glycosylase AlkD
VKLQEQLVQIRAQLTAQADEAVRRSILRFFKEPVDPYGLKTARSRKLAAQVARDVETWTAPQRARLCEDLWKSGKLEEGGMACEVYNRTHKSFGESDFRLFEKWIDRYVHNWAHTDVLCTGMLAAALSSEPRLIAELPAWTKSKNRWKRRAAAVSLIPFAQQGERTAEILALSDLLLGDDDEMVQKGVGWLLKVAYPKRPREVVEFLSARRAQTTRLVLRYAAEKMTPADRESVLAK